MDIEVAIRRAQVYGFLASAFLYPEENWTEDAPIAAEILRGLDYVQAELSVRSVGLSDLQSMYRRAFGVTGSLCYETECGLPHEFRQSQEMADISGFYRAFGFTLGGAVRERPDHLAVELEFMHVLALKEAYALNEGIVEHLEVCADAQRKFLRDHLGGWIGLFAQVLTRNSGSGTYPALAQFAAAFVEADARRLGVQLEQRVLAAVKPTPLGAPISCEGCSAAELLSNRNVENQSLPE